MVSGLAFVDAAHTGTFQQGDAVLPGVNVTLTGKTTLGTSLSATTTTDINGEFQFFLVPNGTYQLSFPTPGFLKGSAHLGTFNAPQGVNAISGIVVSGGQSLSGQLSFQGIDPSIISGRMFLASTTARSFPAGPGPFVSNGGIPDVHINTTGSQNVDLAGFFSVPNFTTTQVTLNISAGGSAFALHLNLFDSQAPQTVANFLNYVLSGGYSNSIFHRLTSVATDNLGVLQGGGAVLHSVPSTTLVPITISNPGVANEAFASNIAGTIAMAQSAGNPNSATDQFFFNLVDNSTGLDPQKFTVFGQVVGSADQLVLDTLATTPVHDESHTTIANSLPSLLLNSVPINLSTLATNDPNFPGNTTAANYVLVNSVTVARRSETLSYSVSSSNPAVATAAIAPNTKELLTIQAAGQIGATTITVTATDHSGNSQSTSFNVFVAAPTP
jgi:cyclophilin family peptidyl-prolyl cis-trans isomerase